MNAEHGKDRGDVGNKFSGSFAELQAHVTSTGLEGTWEEPTPGQHQYRCKHGAVINWWPSKGTLMVQGKAEEKAMVEAKLLSAIEGDAALAGAPRVDPKAKTHQIFVVHGHDKESLEQLELVLRRLGLDPFILMNESAGGKTLIEALEGKIGRDFTSDFGIAIFSPDDFGYAQKDGAAKVEPRARQNVVLETGMLLASLTRARVAILVKGHVEMPSDLGGVIYMGFNAHVREVVHKLCDRMRNAGIEIDPAKITSAAT